MSESMPVDDTGFTVIRVSSGRSWDLYDVDGEHVDRFRVKGAAIERARTMHSAREAKYGVGIINHDSER